MSLCCLIFQHKRFPPPSWTKQKGFLHSLAIPDHKNINYKSILVDLQLESKRVSWQSLAQTLTLLPGSQLLYFIRFTN